MLQVKMIIKYTELWSQDPVDVEKQILNLLQSNNIFQQDNIIDKVYLYAKDLEEPKYQFLIKKREQAGIKNLNDPTAFIKHSNTMDDVYNNIDDYNPKRKRKVLILFDDTIVDIMMNKKYQAKWKELFIRPRKN